MKTFLVEWCIDIDAKTPEEAARRALEIQRNPASQAVVFDVTGENGETTRVDLLELAEGES
jgi:hypothetical protein